MKPVDIATTFSRMSLILLLLLAVNVSSFVVHVCGPSGCDGAHVAAVMGKSGGRIQRARQCLTGYAAPATASGCTMVAAAVARYDRFDGCRTRRTKQ